MNRCYILRERVGEDAFCELWNASAIFSASDFLLRILKKEYATNDPTGDAFAVDAWRSYDVAAPSVLPLIEIDRYDSRAFVVSEFDGYRSLRSELEAGLQVSLERACRLVIELAEGIDAFHQKKLPYGVLSPENIAVTRSGSRIEEFRIQKPSYFTLYHRIPDEQLNDVREAWGYAAPEIKKGEGPSSRADLYSLGIILYRLVVGRLPYGSRSGLRVKERSASPSHVAASLARRDLPKELAAIMVRLIRKNPASRYQDAVGFITDLRDFMEARREALIENGQGDPIADLATLNLKKAKAGAHEIVKRLDTVDYFRILSEGQLSKPDQDELMELIRSFNLSPEAEELEELEAEHDEDDDERDVQSYVEEGYRKVAQEREPKPAPIPVVPPKPAVAPPVQAAAPPPAPAAAPAAAPQAKAAEIPAPATKPEPKAAPAPVAPEPEKPAPKPAPKRAIAEDPPLRWKKSGGTPEEIARELDYLVGRAAYGKGAFRFIEDPGAGHSAEVIARALADLKRKARVADIGVLPEGANARDAGSLLLYALRESFKTEDDAQRAALAAKLEKLGFWNGSTDYLMRAVRAVASRKRPLVLTAAGAETIDETFHAFFTKLAKSTRKAPVCAFFFYTAAGRAKAWHALSFLTQGAAQDRTPSAENAAEAGEALDSGEAEAVREGSESGRVETGA